MKRKIVGLLLLVFGTVAFTACERDYDPTPDYLDDIYPIEDGRTRIYHVTDTIFETTSGDRFEARTYFKRETTDGTEFDLLDREVSKLYVYTSPDTLGTPGNPDYDWTFSELWTQYADDEFYERTEGNTRYLVMRNPPYPGATWNGNLYNNQDAQSYEFLNIDTTVILNGVSYENCVFIEQQEFYKPVQDSLGPIFIIEYAYEIYAPGIGKIARYFKNYVLRDGIPDDEESLIYYEELVAHNYE